VTGPKAQPPAAGPGAPPAGYSGTCSDLPADYRPTAEPLPPGSIRLEDYDAKVKGAAAGAPAAAPAGEAAPARPIEEETEEVMGDVLGGEESQDAAEAPTRWENY